MIEIPFSVLKLLHSNYSCFISTNDDKYEINDANRVPYIAKFNKIVPNLFCVGDENGYIRFFKSSPKLTTIKEINAEKSCIYDIQWLSSHELALGGGDKCVSLIDVNTCTKTTILKGHTESIKSISIVESNPFVIASGARDGSILIYDTRCNKNESQETVTNSLNEIHTVSTVRPIHTILKAHYIDNCPLIHNNNNNNNNNNSNNNTHSANTNSRILKSRTSNFLNICNTQSTWGSNSSLKKSTPVSCVLFQSDFHLTSSGATDGLIKLWDIRKIHPISSHKKYLETMPIYIFDNQINNSLRNADKSIHSKKGYSNLLFNSNKTSLYANCMNNLIYNLNFLTYNNNHTRIINESSILTNENKMSTLNINQSNFIKSSLSNCDNFLLTGSSDFNAYIFSTNINNNLSTFKKCMPVIVLKGHTNEVTTVDWNPIDSNQIVTCSDDNTIRVWNVQREIDIIKSKETECNFCRAEMVDETTNEANSTPKKLNLKPDINYKSLIKFNSRIYNKYRPHCTNIHDDYLFNDFENKKFKFNYGDNSRSGNLNDKIDIENELCYKCEQINIENIKDHGFDYSIKPKDMNIHFGNGKMFLKLEKPLSSLPINLIQIDLSDESNRNEESTSACELDDSGLKIFGFRRQSSFTTLISASLKNENQNQQKTVRSKLKAKILNRQKNLTTPSRKDKHISTDLQQTPNRVSTSTAKKRCAALTSIKENKSNDNYEDQEPKTPQSKRRLIMTNNDCQTTPNKPSNLNPVSMLGSPARTILHYFSPKAIGK